MSQFHEERNFGRYKNTQIFLGELMIYLLIMFVYTLNYTNLHKFHLNHN